MSFIERRTVEELRARYELEPEIYDIYVEGTFDRDLFKHCLLPHAGATLVIYSIDAVDLPAALLYGAGLTEGAKQRVIYLARCLASSSDCVAKVRCFVDRDLDHWFGELEANKFLFWTRYCSIEAYFLTQPTLSSLLGNVLGCKIGDFGAYFAALQEVVRELYLMRLSDRELGWSMEWVALSRCLSKSGERIEIDSEDYIRKLLQKNSKMGELEAFKDTLSKWRPIAIGDHRLTVRGHDLVDIIAWTVQKFGGYRQMADPIAIERSLIAMSPSVNDLCSDILV